MLLEQPPVGGDMDGRYSFTPAGGRAYIAAQNTKGSSG